MCLHYVHVILSRCMYVYVRERQVCKLVCLVSYNQIWHANTDKWKPVEKAAHLPFASFTCMTRLQEAHLPCCVSVSWPESRQLDLGYLMAARILTDTQTVFCVLMRWCTSGVHWKGSSVFCKILSLTWKYQSMEIKAAFQHLKCSPMYLLIWCFLIHTKTEV